MGQNLPHRTSVSRIFAWCISIYGADFVQSQANIDVALSDSQINHPEPYIAALSTPLTELEDDPTPEQIRLVIEVSDSTLAFDRSTKAALYARAGIAEYWIADVVGRRLIVHREPNAEGVWGSVTELDDTRSIAPLGITATAPVAELLPSPR